MNLILSPPFCSPQLLHHCHAFSPTKRLPLPLAAATLSTPDPTNTGVVVVGAGLAGLAAATRLHAARVPFVLLESSDSVGGRVRTDKVDGFLLDRGFQIFITAYPEARRLLDYHALDLRKFYSGALVYHDRRFHRVANPFSHFLDALASLANPIGTVLDKLLVGAARLRAVARSDADILSADEVPIADLLKHAGFSESIVDRFFRPFFGGIFFDQELETTSRLFDFVFKCLALGDNTLPAAGIGSVPEQLAGKLPPGSVRLNSKVAAIQEPSSEVMTESGEVFRGEMGVVVAVEEPEAVKLLYGQLTPRPSDKPDRSTACIYFVSDRSPVKEPVLILNGSGVGIVNNMFFATEVAPSYGPPGKTLVSVSVIGTYEALSEEELAETVAEELAGWFGRTVVEGWKHLRTYRVRFAQPNQSPPTDLAKDPRLGPGLYLCGDHRDSATFDGALVSGRRAAEALLKDSGLL